MSSHDNLSNKNKNSDGLIDENLNAANDGVYNKQVTFGRKESNSRFRPFSPRQRQEVVPIAESIYESHEPASVH